MEKFNKQDALDYHSMGKKGKIEVVEKGMKQLRNMIAKDRQKDKKKKKNN